MKQKNQSIDNKPPEQENEVVVQFPTDEYASRLDLVLQELTANLDLGTADTPNKAQIISMVRELFFSIRNRSSPSEVVEKVDSLLAIVGDIDRATQDLLDGAKAQLEEFEEGYSMVEKNLLPRIAKELESRQLKREEVSATQEDLENQRESLYEELRISTQLIENEACPSVQVEEIHRRKIERDIEGLTTTINDLVQSIAENDKTSAQLKNYSQAIRLIEQGLPDSLFLSK